MKIDEVLMWHILKDEYSDYCERYAFEGFTVIPYEEYVKSLHAAVDEALRKGISITLFVATIKEVEEVLEKWGLDWEPHACSMAVAQLAGKGNKE